MGTEAAEMAKFNWKAAISVLRKACRSPIRKLGSRFIVLDTLANAYAFSGDDVHAIDTYKQIMALIDERGESVDAFDGSLVFR